MYWEIHLSLPAGSSFPSTYLSSGNTKTLITIPKGQFNYMRSITLLWKIVISNSAVTLAPTPFWNSSIVIRKVGATDSLANFYPLDVFFRIFCQLRKDQVQPVLKLMNFDDRESNNSLYGRGVSL